MVNSREFELDLISYCLSKPIYLRQHKKRLEKLKFSDKMVDMVYKKIFECLDKYQTIPTVTELQKMTSDFMSANDKFGAFEIAETMDLIDNIYSRDVTDMTGVNISNYLVEDEAKKLANELFSTKGADLAPKLVDMEHRVSKLRHLYCDKDDLGLNLFSEEGIEEARRLLEAYNDTSCIPTTYTLLDTQLQGGFRKGELVVVLAPTNVGKDQPLNTPVLTPQGWKTMGDMKIGSEVIDWQGNTVNVVGVYPQGLRKVYRVDFSDGTSTECGEEHLWWVRHFSSSKKGYSCRPLKDFMHDLRGKDNRINYFIPVADPVQLPTKEYPLHPYALGCLLGDGGISGDCVKFTCADPELVELLRNALPEEVKLVKHSTKTDIDYAIIRKESEGNNFVKTILDNYGLMGTLSGTKFVPEEYLWGSIEQRLALLQGLMDTDGTLSGTGHTAVDYCCKSLKLIEAAEHLTRSLGGLAKRQKTRVTDGIEYFRTALTLPMCPFKLSRKANLWNSREHKPLRKAIEAVTFVGYQETQCIKVDSPTSSYLTTDFIVTHNTAALLNFAANFLRQGLRVVYLVLDNIQGEMIARTLGCLMNQDITQGIDPNIALTNFSNQFKDKYKNKFFYKHYAPRELNKSILERYLNRLKTYLYEYDKADGIPLEDCGKIDVVVIDYMDLMVSESGAGEFWIAAEHLAQELKAVLKNYDILGLTATQGGTEAMKADTLKLYMAQGAKSKFNAPDLVLSLSQTDQERMAKPSIIRLGCLKARRAAVNYQIKMRFHREKQIIEEDPDCRVVLSMAGINQDAYSGGDVKQTNDYSKLYNYLQNNIAKQNKDADSGQDQDT